MLIHTVIHTYIRKRLKRVLHTVRGRVQEGEENILHSNKEFHFAP